MGEIVQVVRWGVQFRTISTSVLTIGEAVCKKKVPLALYKQKSLKTRSLQAFSHIITSYYTGNVHAFSKQFALTHI